VGTDWKRILLGLGIGVIAVLAGYYGVLLY